MHNEAAPKTEISKILDMSVEDFNKYCADKDLGYLLGFENYLTVLFNQLVNTKNALVLKIKEGDDTEIANMTLSGVFMYMTRLEQRIFLVREMCSSRKKMT